MAEESGTTKPGANGVVAEAPTEAGTTVLDQLRKQVEAQQNEPLEQFAARMMAPPVDGVLWELVSGLMTQYGRTAQVLERLKKAEGSQSPGK